MLFRILLFFLIATIFSGIFHSAFFPLHDSDNHGGFSDIRIIATLLLTGAGPVLASVLCWAIFGTNKKRATLLGSWPKGALAAFFTPILALTIVGYESSFSINTHLFGAFVGFLVVIYGVCEEMGWRGYINDQLRPANRLVRILMTTLVWWTWHLWFVQGNISDGTLHVYMDLRNIAITLILLAAASALFVTTIDESHSILEVGAFHALGSILFTMPILNLSTNTRAIATTIVLVFLLIIHAGWKKRDQSQKN